MERGVTVIGVVEIDRQRTPHLSCVALARRRDEDGVVAGPRLTEEIGRRGGVDGAAQAPT